MAIEKIIHQHLPYMEAGEHNHVSMASIRRRRQEIENMVWEWRQDQVEYYEKRLGYVENDQFIPYKIEEKEIYNCE